MVKLCVLEKSVTYSSTRTPSYTLCIQIIFTLYSTAIDLCYNDDSPRVDEDANSISLSIDFAGCVGNALCVAPSRGTTADCKQYLI